jgi:hypothetical protein
MNLRPVRLCPALVVLASLLSAGESQAAVLIGNLPASVAGNSVVSSTQTLAVSFRTPSVAYAVDSVILSLATYATTAGDAAVVGFYTDNSGIPGTLVTSLLTNPASSSTAAASFTFTAPTGGISLSADTTYWLQVARSAGNFRWNVGTGATPSGLATFGEFKWRNSLGNWNTSASANLFSIEATAVPEPEEYAAAAAAGLLGFGLWRRARRPA